MSLDVKLVAYEPYGARIAELPQPLGVDAADPLSDVPSLTVKYSKYMAGASILERPIEVAREVLDPITGQWIEPVNSRYLLIKTEGDRLDATGTMNYICPGYSWLLNKVQVYPLAKSITDGQVADAEKTEGTKRTTLNAREQTLGDTLKIKTPHVEYSTSAPSSTSSNVVWVDTTTPHEDLSGVVPKTYNKTQNQWVSHGTNATNDPQARAAWAAYKAYVGHQESQGQLRDTQDRARLTKRVFTGMHAGAIMAQLIAEARGRGNRMAGLVTKFTATKDSAGQPWPKTSAKIEVNTGTSLLRVLQTFVETGQLDFRTNGRELQVYTQDTAMMRDNSASIHLRYGLHVDEAPDKGTWEHVANEVLFVGDDGLHFSKSNPETPQPWGTWETSVVQTNVDSEATGTLLSANMLKESAGPRVERTRALMLREDVNGPLPYIHYLPGDYIMAPNSEGVMESQRIQQITLSKDPKSGNVTGNLILNDRFLEREIRNQRTAEAVISGGVVSGGAGTKSPETYVDLRTPEAPRYLTVEAETQAIEGGQYQSVVGLGWWWSRKATNGTSMEGAVAHYQVQYRLFQEGTSSFDGNRLSWRSTPQVDSNSTTTVVGPLETYNTVTQSPATYELRVRVYATNGKVSSWSSTARITVPLDDTPPEPPSRPSVVADGPLISVTWDGKNQHGGNPPVDFSHMVIEEAELTQDEADYIRYGYSKELGDEPTQAQIDAALAPLEWKVADAAGDLVSKGTAMIPSRQYNRHYVYRMIAVDYTGNRSEPSKPSGVVTPRALVDVSKIQAELDAGNLVMDGVKDQIYATMKVTRDKLSAEGVMEESVAKAFYGDIASFIRISTTQLMVSDPVVYTPNFDEEPESWFLFGEGTAFQKGSSTGLAEGSTLLSLPANVLAEAVAPRKRVYPGEKFGYRYKYQRLSGADGALSLRVRFYDADGKQIIGSTYVDTIGPETSGTITSEDKTRVPEVPVVPAGAYEVEVLVRYTPGTVTTGSVAVAGLQVHKQVGATLIENGAITTDKIIANAITADKISANAIEADHISANAITADKIETAELWAKMVTADMFVGKEFQGGTFTGATFQTSALANRGLKIDATNGLRMWSSVGVPTFDMDMDTGMLHMTGRLRTGRDGEPGIIVSNASSGWNGVDQGVWFTTDGTAYGWGSTKGSVAGMFTVSDPDDGAAFPLHVRGNSGAGVYVWDRVKIAKSVDGFGTAQVQFTGTGLITGGGEVQIRPGADLELGVTGTNVIKFTRGIGTGYNLSTGASANMYMDSNGFLHKTGSARKYKANITEYQPDPEILYTPLLRWQDKRSVETYERLKDSPHPLNEDDQRAWDMMDLTWHTGSTSEDALAHKADAIVTYANGEVDGLSYDRFAFLMLPFLRELWDDYKARTAN